MITTITNPETGKTELAISLGIYNSYDEIRELSNAIIESIKDIANDKGTCGENPQLYYLAMLLGEMQPTEKQADTIGNTLFAKTPQPQQL